MDFVVYGVLKRLITNKEDSIRTDMENNHQEALDLIAQLDARLQFIANSTDEDLDQIAELVSFIKENRESILTIFADKVNIADIVDNLITEKVDVPLSAN